MSDTARWTGPAPPQSRQRQASGQADGANLADILERVLDKGIVIAGDIQVNLLDIELLTIKIRLVVASVDRAKEMGIDWWERDPTLSAGRRELEDENRELRQRIEALERGRLERDGDPGREHDGSDEFDAESDGGFDAESEELGDDPDEADDVVDDVVDGDDEPPDHEPEEPASRDDRKPTSTARRRPARRSSGAAEPRRR